jgi:protoporphyrin/coproporphyrin ferrochelatase
VPFAPEPERAHGTQPSTAILLCNLGTPDAPTPAALRRYLGEFLSDSRVVEIPKLLWWPILHGIILRLRPAKSARKYASIWTPEGSPLLAGTGQLAERLGASLREQGHAVTVRFAMRYGNPSIAKVLDELKAQHIERILLLPLYPQYSGPTTASAIDALGAWARRVRRLPELRILNHYHDDPGYIGALAESVSEHWQTHGRPDKLVLSFHGVPRRTLLLGDPYHCECQKTARLLSERLGLSDDMLTLTFQSRFGKAQWLQPYTEPTLIELAQRGVKRVDVLCPGFAVDCLETLEEIAVEARSAFLRAGGQAFHYLPCLNARSDWIAALEVLALRHLQGWDTIANADAPPLEAQRKRALALGASK